MVRDVAVENKATKIQKVVMQIGEVSTIVNDQLIDCWNWNANRTDLLRGCTLEIEPIKAVTYCEDCKKSTPPSSMARPAPIAAANILTLFEGMKSWSKKSPLNKGSNSE